MPPVSVIIPVLNEAEHIEILLLQLQKMDTGLEIIVVDGGSSDSTVEIARQYATVINSRRGRALQMNTGARHSAGLILWFLHADCLPHSESIRAMKEVLQNSEISGGAFEYNLSHPGLIFRLTEFFSNRKNKLFKQMFGDMGIFVRREIFFEIGTFPEIPLMEDMEFARKLRSNGKIVILPHRVQTSARRWIEEGPLKNIFRNWLLQIAWKLGTPPHQLARWYQFR